MFKYVFLLLISLTCMASEPKFHFRDCVEVVSGFYRGCQGKVDSFYDDGDTKASYQVALSCRGYEIELSFYETELKGCKTHG